jgi:hypothetical protein
VTGEDETRNMLWSPGCRIQHVKAWPFFLSSGSVFNLF